MTPSKASVHFGFSASGWLKAYQFGAAHAIRENGLISPESHFAGSSGGSLVAAALALDLDILRIHRFILRCSQHVRENPNRAFQLRQYVRACIRRNVPSRAVPETSGRLHVSVTLLPSLRNSQITTWTTFEQFEEALLASCTMSPIAGFPFQLSREGDELDGSWVFDGGLSAMVPTVDLPGETVTCSPFFFAATDIRPRSYVPLWWALYPPSPRELDELFWRGYADTLAWAEARRLVPAADAPAPQTAAARAAPTMLSSASAPGAQGKRGLSATRLPLSVAVPSFFLDIIFALCCALLIKPLAYLCLSVELLARFSLSGWCAAFVYTERARRWVKPTPFAAPFSLRHWLLPDDDDLGVMALSARQSARGALTGLYSLSLRSLPLVGKAIVRDVDAALGGHSLVFQLLSPVRTTVGL